MCLFFYMGNVHERKSILLTGPAATHKEHGVGYHVEQSVDNHYHPKVVGKSRGDQLRALGMLANFHHVDMSNQREVEVFLQEYGDQIGQQPNGTLILHPTIFGKVLTPDKLKDPITTEAAANLAQYDCTQDWLDITWDRTDRDVRAMGGVLLGDGRVPRRKNNVTIIALEATSDVDMRRKELDRAGIQVNGLEEKTALRNAQDIKNNLIYFPQNALVLNGDAMQPHVLSEVSALLG
jgi:hypothetical protein